MNNKSGEGDKDIFENYRKSIFPYLILAVLLFITFAITYIFYHSAKSKDALRFSNQTARLHYAIENKLRLYVTLLKGGRGFLEATPILDRQTFARFANSLDFQNDYKGVQGIAYSERISADEIKKVQKKLQAEGVANFAVFPEGERDFYQPVLYVEPLTDSAKSVIGYDIATDSARLEAIKRARDTNEVAMTGKIVPVNENPADKIYGFTIYLPIYKTENVPATVEEREKSIRGFIYCPFRANKFLDEIYHDENKNDIAIKIYDADAKPENLLAETTIDGRNAGFADSRQIARDELNFGGRKWIIEFATLPEFTEQSSVAWTPLILICGLTFSFVLFGMSYWEAAASAKVKKTAGELLDSQAQREILFENEQKARKTAEEANASKDEFIAIVSHELKTPLNAIGGWTRILKSNDLTENTREIALHKINKNLRLQTAMVEQLLSYSEVISKNYEPETTEIDFTKLFDEACSEIEPLFEEKNISFKKKVQSGNCFIEGDEEKLKMVIYNLFSNSFKFTPNGGNITAELSHHQNGIRLIFKDNGRGISEEFLPFVFERYKQADKPNIRDYGGLGLGMTITKNIVRLHHGKIKAESEGKDKGSTFTVEFPCAKKKNV